jgi:hypothetical protein
MLLKSFKVDSLMQLDLLNLFKSMIMKNIKALTSLVVVTSLYFPA